MESMPKFHTRTVVRFTIDMRAMLSLQTTLGCQPDCHDDKQWRLDSGHAAARTTVHSPASIQVSSGARKPGSCASQTCPPWS